MKNTVLLRGAQGASGREGARPAWWLSPTFISPAEVLRDWEDRSFHFCSALCFLHIQIRPFHNFLAKDANGWHTNMQPSQGRAISACGISGGTSRPPPLLFPTFK